MKYSYYSNKSKTTFHRIDEFGYVQVKLREFSDWYTSVFSLQQIQDRIKNGRIIPSTAKEAGEK